MQNYITKAIRTESIEGAKDRLLLVPQQVGEIMPVLKMIDKIDDLKKFIYYGKPMEGVQTETLPGIDTIYIPEDKIRLLHAGLGLLTEAQEFLIPILESIMRATPLDVVNLKEELGDTMWYQAIACNVVGTTFEIEQERNIAKLSARYPDKFTEDKAINRDLETERKVLSDA